MRLVRFYRAGIKYGKTYTDDYINKLKEQVGDEEARNIDNANYALVLESLEEEKSWFFDCCQRVIANPRWYLNHLDELTVFSVRIKEIFPNKVMDGA